VRDPNQRFSSASEFAEALTVFADDRSGQVIQRIRGGRGRSLMPPTPSATPPNPAVAAPGVRAATYPNVTDPLRPPKVPTDVGVTRETPPGMGQTAPKASKAPLIIAFTAVVLLCAAGGVVVVKRAGGGTTPATHDTATTSTATVAPPPATTATPSTPTASLEPLPLPTAAPSTSVSSSAPTNTAAAPPASTKPHTPTNLNGVQPHF
jgi:hypothetical protein